jgi:hypothetical protein
MRYSHGSLLRIEMHDCKIRETREICEISLADRHRDFAACATLLGSYAVRWPSMQLQRQQPQAPSPILLRISSGGADSGSAI